MLLVSAAAIDVQTSTLGAHGPKHGFSMLHFRYLDRRWKVTLNAAQVGQSLQLDLAMGPKAGIKWRGLPNKGWLKSLLSYIWNAQSG